MPPALRLQHGVSYPPGCCVDCGLWSLPDATRVQCWTVGPLDQFRIHQLPRQFFGFKYTSFFLRVKENLFFCWFLVCFYPNIYSLRLLWHLVMVSPWKLLNIRNWCFSTRHWKCCGSIADRSHYISSMNGFIPTRRWRRWSENGVCMFQPFLLEINVVNDQPLSGKPSFVRRDVSSQWRYSICGQHSHLSRKNLLIA